MLPTRRDAMPQIIEFSIRQADITSFDADVVALKYAQYFYGTDRAIASLLIEAGVAENTLCPYIGEYRYISTYNRIQAHHALFVGVPSLEEFDYKEIQKFSAQVLSILAKEAPHTRHLAMTIHGAGFGLDETEALFAQF